MTLSISYAFERGWRAVGLCSPCLWWWWRGYAEGWVLLEAVPMLSWWGEVSFGGSKDKQTETSLKVPCTP